MSNHKIKNATPKEYNGIKFKSLQEVSIYKELLSAGFKPEYEKNTYIIWEGYKPSIPFYDLDLKTKQLKLKQEKLRNITYTPDFVFEYKSVFVIIEVKGFENDVFPIKKKLFRRWLEENKQNCLFFEIRSKKQLLEAIKIIQNYEKSYSQNTNTT